MESVLRLRAYLEFAVDVVHEHTIDGEKIKFIKLPAEVAREAIKDLEEIENLFKKMVTNE